MSSPSRSTSSASSDGRARAGRRSPTGTRAGPRDLLREALDLWSGPPLAGLEDEPFAQPYIARIEDLRLSAVEDRIEADLALGRHAELVGELQALVSEFPLRERLRGQLMLALYRSGRQAEALSAYRDARQLLADELGIDPTPDLQRLEGAILRQDPDLDLAPATRRTVRPPHDRHRETSDMARGGCGSSWSGRHSWSSPSRRLVVVATATRVRRPPSAVAPNSVGRIDAATDELVGRDPDDRNGADRRRLGGWVAVGREHRLADRGQDRSRDEPRRPDGAERAAPRPISRRATGCVWVLNGLDGTVLAIDPRTNEVTGTIDVPVGSGGIAVGAGAVWVTERLDATVVRIDPETRQVVGRSRSVSRGR